MKQILVKEPGIRKSIVNALRNTNESMKREDVLSYVVQQTGVFSVKPHTFAAALSTLKKQGKIKQSGTNDWILNSEN